MSRKIPAKMSIEEYQGFMETGALPEDTEVLGAMAKGTGGRLPAPPTSQPAAQQLIGGGTEARIQGGRDAQAGGKQFEADLELTHQVYLKTKEADICRLPVNTQPMPRSWLNDPKKPGGMARILSERQRADYFGVLGPHWPNIGGQCIQMEAKSQLEATKGLSILPKGKAGHGLKAHQLAGLVQAYEFGALVAVVWRNGPNRLVFTGAVLEKAYREFRLNQIKRLEASWAVPYEYRREQGVMIHDWLRSAR